MGVDYDQYTGFGIKLANAKNFNKVHDYLDSQEPKWNDMYSINFDDSNIEFIEDGYSGSYIYLLYTLESYDVLCDNDGAFMVSFNELKEAFNKATIALQAAYKKLNLGELKVEDIKFISMTHVC